MPTPLEEAWFGAGRTGAALPAEQQKKLQELIGFTGAGDTLTKKEFKKGQKTYKKSGQQFGDYLSAIAGTVGESALDPKLQKKYEKKGYTGFEGYYTTKAPVTQAGIQSLAASGFSPKDVQSFIAGRFANQYLTEEARRFLGSTYSGTAGYELDPSTGRYQQRNITGITITGDGEISPLETGLTQTTTKGSGIYAGLDPDTMKGSTPYEMQYATLVDPYKIQAKSAERISKIGQGTALYGLIGNVI